ncbi:MAG TPA: hypothetical protein VGA99_04865 [bacterium]
MGEKIKSRSFVMLGLIFCSCSPAQQNEETLRHAMIGEWRNVSIHVTTNSVNNSDSSAAFAADESNWEEKLRMKPIRTFYLEDGTYYSEYHNLSDSLFHKASGTWSVRSDTLILNQQQPDVETYKSKVVLKEDLGEFTILLDWDRDGTEDDLYFGVQRKQQ